MIMIPPSLIQQIRSDLKESSAVDFYRLGWDLWVMARRVTMTDPEASWVVHRFMAPKSELCFPAGLLFLPIRGRSDFSVEIDGLQQSMQPVGTEYFTTDASEVRPLSMMAFSHFVPCDVKFSRRGEEPCELDMFLVVTRAPAAAQVSPIAQILIASKKQEDA